MTTATNQAVPPDTEGEEVMLCPHCLEPIDGISHFCNACGGPVSAYSAVDPMGQVYSAGHAYRQATGKSVKFITVLGIWLIFAPQLLPLIFITLGLTSEFVLNYNDTAPSGFDMHGYVSGLTGILVTLGMSVIYFLLIYKTTRAYIRTRRRERGLCPDCLYDLRGRVGTPSCPECGCRIEWFLDDGEEVLQQTERGSQGG